MNYHLLSELNFALRYPFTATTFRKLDFYRYIQKELSFATLHKGYFLNHTKVEDSIIKKH